MLVFIGKRLLMLIPILLGISIIVQVLIDITPGDPVMVMLGGQATQEEMDEVRERLGLNDSLPVRYVRYMRGVLQGDFGRSLVSNRPVFDEMATRFPYTLLLVALSISLSILIGIPVGVYAATHQNTWRDNASMFVALFCVSMPSFWFGLMLIQQFAVRWRWLPVAGGGSWNGWVLPIVSMALGITSTIARQTRSNMLEVTRQDFVTTARAKGLGEGRIRYRHALKNAMIPVVMVIGNLFGSLLGGSLIAEVIFSLPGLGQYTIQGLRNRDYPIIQSSVLILSVLFAIVILLVDIMFALIDPRIRSQYTRKSTRGKNKKKGVILIEKDA